MANTPLPLNTGATIPALGLGTWQSSQGEVQAAVFHALGVGYRHIDCAFMYGNEAEVGAGLAEAFKAGICKREQVFVTTKLWCTYHSRVQEALDISLQRLGLDYVDLYLMHWPLPMNPNGNHPNIPRLPDGSRDLQKDWSHVKTWKEMEKLLDTGKTKAIGVSNYSVKYLKELLPQAQVVPAVNQIENHPYLPQQDIKDFCDEKGILVTAYSPFGSTDSPLMQEDGVQEVAKKRGITPGMVLLGYHFARGNSVLAKSVTRERIEANFRLFDLDKDDLKALNSISAEKGTKRFVYPDFGVDFGFPDKSPSGEQ